MSKLFFLFTILCIASADKWAVFISAREMWQNYCISSTICRGYDLVHDAGFDEDHMIYMGYRNVWDAEENPFPGQIFTDPSEGPGIDYAAGCKNHLDYDDDYVSFEVFKAIFRADRKKVTELTGIENPKVLDTHEDDTIFIYYMDHCTIGMCEIGIELMHEDELMELIDEKYKNKQYKEMVFYFEGCHSGSMFRSLEKGKNVYAFTGADTEHSSWMCNCPPYDVVDGKALGVCLSAYYDNYWMQQVTAHGSDISNNEMFKIVHDRVAEKSDQNVSQFGDIDTIGEKSLKEYIGDYIPKSYPKDTSCSEGTKYEDVSMHLAKWATIRDGSTKLDNLKKAVEEDALKDILIMRTARAYYQDDKKADASKYNRPASYDNSCMKDMSMMLIAKCGYSLPFKDEHITVLENICSNGAVRMDFENIC